MILKNVLEIGIRGVKEAQLDITQIILLQTKISQNEKGNNVFFNIKAKFNRKNRKFDKKLFNLFH